MNNNNIDTIKDYYNIEEGTYKVYFDDNNSCYLFDSFIKYVLDKNKSELILGYVKCVKNIKHEIIKILDQYYSDYNIKFICQEKYMCDETNEHKCNCKCNCEEEHKYKEINIKINNEDPFSIYKENIISELGAHSSYAIINFSNVFRYNNYISENYGCITAIKNICAYNPILENRKYYVNEKVISTLNKYFKCEDGKIVCIYNNKKEIAELTLITGKKSWMGIFQSLMLKIGNKIFNFYINRYKNSEKISRDTKFLVFHNINHNTQGKIILGYAPYKNMYYKLSSREMKNNINQEMAEKIEYKEHDLYTYILFDNKRYGLTKNNNSNEYKLLSLDLLFENALDISLLKPVSEWNK